MSADCPVCKRQPPARPQLCNDCRRWTDGRLTGIVTLWQRLPAGLEPGAAGAGQRVSGSHDAPLPLRVAALDLSLPARHATRALHARGYLGLDDDQTGTLSAATILDTWVRDWRTQGAPGADHLPNPNVPTLARWLRVRLDWACDRHPAIDEFADELDELWRALAAAAGDTPQRPQPCPGIPCRRCDLRTLVRRPDGSGRVDCANPDCRTVYTSDDYARWTRLLAAATAAAPA